MDATAAKGGRCDGVRQVTHPDVTNSAANGAAIAPRLVPPRRGRGHESSAPSEKDTIRGTLTTPFASIRVRHMGATRHAAEADVAES